MRIFHHSWFLRLLYIAVFVPGCSRGPARVNQPHMNASDAGSDAIAKYDSNRDGQIAGEELQKAPALVAALPRLDSNGDGGVTAEEMSERVKVWQQMRTGLMSFPFTVTLDGSPLFGATVTFDPVEYLGDEIKPASCVTDPYGGGGATIAKQNRPDPTSPPGMHLGLYKVRISKMVGGKETIPTKYNAQTILGQEVANDVPEIANRRVNYELTTK
ncbi:MAG: hypothetical protein WD851_08190 [Pirellulales bacterium]